MNTYIYINKVVKMVVCVSLFHLFTFSPLTADAKKHKQLVILHTNDTHSTILPLNPNIDNKDIAGRGGFLRRINMIKEQRSQNPDLLLFDSGDFSQGSGYYTLFKGEVEVGLMNQMGYERIPMSPSFRRAAHSPPLRRAKALTMVAILLKAR